MNKDKKALVIVDESRRQHIEAEKKLRGIVDYLMGELDAIKRHCEASGHSRHAILRVQMSCQDALTEAARQLLTEGEAARNQITRKR